jgi:hypothetical protein
VLGALPPQAASSIASIKASVSIESDRLVLMELLLRIGGSNCME